MVISSSSTSATTVLQLAAYESDTATGSNTLARHSLRAASVPASAPWKMAGSGIALAGLICLFIPGRRKRITGLLVAVFSIGVLTLSGCSTQGSVASAQTNATAVTYTITVTATGTNAAGATLSHSSNITFVVQ